ncbi:Clavaminate synthase-like protein [Annulohypoxylon bovei var. microspora]|nr:Clavaminate synthase-like protein [Annulohypoxylon bovei var. microspora]
MPRWPPTLNASPIFSKDKLVSTSYARRSFAAELVSQLRKYGVARLSHHGVAPITIKELFKYHRHFFNLPSAHKLSVLHPGGESPARGFSPWAYEKTAVLRPDLHDYASPSSTTAGTQLSKALLDAREQFAVGPPSDTEFPTPQLSERILPGFNTAMKQAYSEIADSCRQLVDVIEEGLDAPTGSISDAAAGGQGAELNLNFYPEVEGNVLKSNTDTVVMRRIWPHSDLGVISALFQDGLGSTGLEILVRESSGEQFVPVPIEGEGDMILLAANTLERWTNGQVLAAIHRVGFPHVDSSLSNSSLGGSKGVKVPERRSAVMFFRAPPTADLGPLPHFVSVDNPARYEHIVARDYLKSHNKRLYSLGVENTHEGC